MVARNIITWKPYRSRLRELPLKCVVESGECEDLARQLKNIRQPEVKVQDYSIYSPLRYTFFFQYMINLEPFLCMSHA